MSSGRDKEVQRSLQGSVTSALIRKEDAPGKEHMRNSEVRVN